MEIAGDTPTLEEAQQWPIAMTHFQQENNCDLTIRAEEPTLPIPAHPDWSNTTLLAENNDSKNPQRLLEFPDGRKVLLSYKYRNMN